MSFNFSNKNFTVLMVEVSEFNFELYSSSFVPVSVSLALR